MEKYNMALTYNQNVTDYKNTILWKDIGYKPSKRHPCPFLADLCITIFSKQGDCSLEEQNLSVPSFQFPETLLPSLELRSVPDVGLKIFR